MPETQLLTVTHPTILLLSCYHGHTFSVNTKPENHIPSILMFSEALTVCFQTQITLSQCICSRNPI